MEGGDWRRHLRPDSRQRIINKILETLKRHLPFSGEEGLHELNRIAVRFEEKVYSEAVSQSAYLRRISSTRDGDEVPESNGQFSSIKCRDK